MFRWWKTPFCPLWTPSHPCCGSTGYTRRTGCCGFTASRRQTPLRLEDLPKLGVVLKRAQFFVTCGGRMRPGLHFSAATLSRQLEAMERGQLPPQECRQLSLFDAG